MTLNDIRKELVEITERFEEMKTLRTNGTLSMEDHHKFINEFRNRRNNLIRQNYRVPGLRELCVELNYEGTYLKAARTVNQLTNQVVLHWMSRGSQGSTEERKESVRRFLKGQQHLLREMND